MHEDVLELIVRWRERHLADTVPKKLDGLFDQLQSPSAKRDAFEIEDAIWEIWTAHPDPIVSSRMDEAIASIAQRNYAHAENVLNELVSESPGWAEAWNKRATLYFLQGRDNESVADIGKTLELEPRHFGAISGFAQICLRRADPQSALIAMEVALQVNPHLHSVKAALHEVRSRYRPITH